MDRRFKYYCKWCKKYAKILKKDGLSGSENVHYRFECSNCGFLQEYPYTLEYTNRPTPILKGESAKRFYENINNERISERQKKFLNDCEQILIKYEGEKHGRKNNNKKNI